MDEDSKLEVFTAYAHEDKLHLAEFHKHLGALKREKLIAVWHDAEILAGDVWEKHLKEHLESASIIVTLISSDFISSEYCWEKELARAIERHYEGTARVFPIIVRACDWTPLRQLQAAPKDGLAVTSWPNQDEAWTDVVQQLRRVIATFGPHGDTATKKP